MNNILYVISGFVFLPAFLFSQNAEEVKIENPINKKAVLFSFNGLNLSSYNGGLGWKKWYSRNFVIHNMVQIMFSEDKKGETDELRGDERKQVKVELSFGIQKQFDIINRISPYFGGQLGIGHEKATHEITPTDGFYLSYKYETKSTLTYFSTYLIFGVEYFLKSNLSLSGQYQLGGYYGFGEENTNVFNVTRDISKINYGVQSSSLILSIYL